MIEAFQLYESYDIKSDKQIMRVNIRPRDSRNKYCIVLDEDMSTRQMGDVLRVIATAMIEDTTIG